MKKIDKLNKDIQNKRALYIKGIIDNFIDCGLEYKNIQNCFSFVNDNFRFEDFTSTLNSQENELIGSSVDNWFSFLSSIENFNVFLSNIDYQKKLNN